MGLGGAIGPSPEDFRVEEVPAYLPSGTGTHFYLEVEKRGLSTPFVRDALARAAGVKPMDIGFAGRKDTAAVTKQWFSMPCPPVDPGIEGLTLGPATPHGNKLRLGHLKGNRFEIRLCGLAPEAAERWPALQAAIAPPPGSCPPTLPAGFPNYYGEQRFGHGQSNVGRAYDLLANPRVRVRDPEFLASALQSAMFNRWLGERVRDDLLHAALLGDVLRKRESGGLFVCEAPEVDTVRVVAGEVDPTGPMPGARTMGAVEAAGAREVAAVDFFGLTADERKVLDKFAPGTRRPARVVPEGLDLTLDGDTALLRFTLPPGTFATVLLGELCQPTGSLRPEAPVPGE